MRALDRISVLVEWNAQLETGVRLNGSQEICRTRVRFVRIHRSVIVNVRKIKELQPCDSGEYIAVLGNGKELSCKRGDRAEVSV